MKRINLLIIASILVSIGSAQQFPLQSQYQFNYSSINPAANGENDFYSVRASLRDQWKNLAGVDPIRTQILTGTKRFNNNGLGVTFFNDDFGGSYSASGASFSYSRRVQFGASDLFLGLSAGSSKYNILVDPNSGENVNTIDAVFSASFGAYYVYDDFRFGLSVPGLTNSNLDLPSGSPLNTINKHVYTMFSYDRKINEDWSLHPSVLVKTTSNNNQIDLNINCKLKNTLWFGASYRTSPGGDTQAQEAFGPSFYLGIDVGRVLAIYSYDISLGQMGDNSDGSHELTLGYDFIPDDEMDFAQESTDAGLISDQDNDGVADEDDICPAEFGDPNANGCPDFDKDGVPDKFDLCPHLFGNSEAQGCPELTAAEQRILSDALEDFQFKQGQFDIEYESYSSLSKLAVLLHTNPTMYLSIQGYASSEGTESYNLTLSAKRAKAVQNFFIERGIDRTRLLMDFYGEESPLNANFTEEQRAANRRVEFDIRYHLKDVSAANNMKSEYNALLANMYVEEVEPINVIEQDDIAVEDPKVIIVEDVTVEDVVVEEIATEDVVVEDVVVEESSEEIVTEDIESPTVLDNDNIDSDRHLVVVQVFSSLSNALSYMSNVNGARYINYKNKYYVYAFSSNNREEAERFRSQYNKDCWILDL